MGSFLEVLNLTKSYKDKVALDNFSFKFKSGIYGVLGANGAGKSTLFKLLTDNIRRDSGKILYNNREILTLGGKYRSEIGYMPQKYGLYENFSPTSFLLYMSALKGISKKDAIPQIKKLLEIVNLNSQAEDRISHFSEGMKQRLHLANALLGNPNVIILDEPTAGLDPNERIGVRNMIAGLANERIVIYSTHIVSDIESIAENVLILENGVLKQCGTPFELMSSVEGKVFEAFCKKNEIEALRKKYPINNVRQNNDGLLFRTIADTKPCGFVSAIDNISLEDAYLYFSHK